MCEEVGDYDSDSWLRSVTVDSENGEDLRKRV